MAFLCSPQNITNSLKTNKGKKPISLGQQALVAILFTLVYHFWVYFTWSSKQAFNDFFAPQQISIQRVWFFFEEGEDRECASPWYQWKYSVKGLRYPSFSSQQIVIEQTNYVVSFIVTRGLVLSNMYMSVIKRVCQMLFFPYKRCNLVTCNLRYRWLRSRVQFSMIVEAFQRRGMLSLMHV